jgi:TP901 family phage tail tape measure protein
MPLLAQLVVEYVADVSKLTSGVQAAGQAQDNMTSKANAGASALLGFAAGAAAIATTAIVGISVASTKMAADFQQGVTGLETSGNELHSNLKMVGDGMLDLAVKTGTTTTDLTKGMLQIESAGYHGADGLNVLKNAAEGAKTGQSSLKDVSNGLTTAMVDYHEPVSKAAEVTNDLIATMKNGKTTMGELASSLKDVLPFASTAGISLNNVSAAMSTLTSQGIPAGQSATFLKTMILSLEAPSTKGAAVLQSVGLSAQDVATKMKTSLPGALQMITDHLKTKFPEGSAAYTKALKDIAGGSSSLAAILGLTGDNMTTFKGNVDNIAGSVKAGGDSIQGWAVTQQDFNFQMDKAREVVETMGIKLGTALLPKVGELLSKIMPIITQFGNWLISSHVLENAIGTLSNAIGGTITVVTNIVTFFQKNQAAFEALKIAVVILAGALAGALVGAMILATIAAWNMAIAFLANPIVWIAIAIGVAVALIVLAIMHWGQIVAWLQGIWGAFTGWFMGIVGAIGAFFTGVWTGIQTGTQNAWNFIVNAVRAGASLLLAIVLGPIYIIANAFIWLYNHNYYFKALVDAIIGFFQMLFNWAVDGWKTFISGLTITWNNLVGFASMIWGQVAGAIQSGFSIAIGFVVGIWTAISTVFSGAWNTYIAGPIGSMWNSLVNTANGWAATATNWGVNLIQGFINGIMGMLSNVGKAASDIAGKVAQFLGFHSPTELGVGADADTWAPNFVNMYSKGLLNGIPQIQDAVDNLIKPVAVGVKGTSSLGANTNSAPLQGGGDKQEIHIHNYHYLDGKDITDNVMTRVVKAGRRGPIR